MIRSRDVFAENRDPFAAANNVGDPDNKIIRPNSSDRDYHALTVIHGENIVRKKEECYLIIIIMFNFTLP